MQRQQSAGREGQELQDQTLQPLPCRASQQHEALATDFAPSRSNRRMEPLVCHLCEVDHFEVLLHHGQP